MSEPLLITCEERLRLNRPAKRDVVEPLLGRERSAVVRPLAIEALLIAREERLLRLRLNRAAKCNVVELRCFSRPGAVARPLAVETV